MKVYITKAHGTTYPVVIVRHKVCQYGYHSLHHDPYGSYMNHWTDQVFDTEEEAVKNLKGSYSVVGETTFGLNVSQVMEFKLTPA